MNQVLLTGNLTRDPELRTTPTGKAVVSVSIATNKVILVNNEKRKETQFHNLVIWGKRGETFAQYLRKGSKVLVEGELRYREYENKDKQKVKITEILVDEFEFLDSAKKSEPKNDSGQFEDPFPPDELNVDNIPL